MSESVATDVWFPGSRADPPEDHDGEATPLPFYLTDHIRSFNTFGCYIAGQPWLSRAPHGDGHGVMVLPGLGAGDLSTFPLRRFLQRLGYQVSGWGLGLNVGPTAKVIHGLRDRVTAMADHTGGRVSLVGWSLGGIFARG